ncbi:related to multidrug resistance protein [Fusarium oxysporum]|uniref:Related to multidrug resistance protein n=1 Tax=Fusarium oxysporum TaxID=5507 RepID=A0A2H3UE75_FUSOX|nr:related to multidrug resistance protein [Fusarium oxysporum]
MTDSWSVTSPNLSSPSKQEIRSLDDLEGTPEIDLKRLGRSRPALLSNALIEIGFVLSTIGSLMMSEYFISGFNVVLPQISEALDIPQSLRTWPAGVPSLTTAALLLPFARLGDQYGARWVFLCGHAWLLVWSIVSGFSKNSTMLIVSRAMQGVGAGAFMPTAVSLLSSIYRPGPRKNLVFGLYGACGCLGFYVGILIAGICAQLINWSWFFWIEAICEAVVLLCGLLTVPKKFGHGNANVHMDWYGLLTIVPGLCLVIYSLTDGGHAPEGWRSPRIYATFVAGALLLSAAVYVEGWVAKDPLLPPHLFRVKYMRRITFGLLCTYGVFGLFLFYGTFYFETVLHTTPIQTALWFTPLAGGGILLAILGGFILHLVPGRVLLMFAGVTFIPSAMLLALMPEQSVDGEPSKSFLYWAYIFPGMVCATLGVDTIFNVTNVFITTAMPSRFQAATSGLITSLLYLSITLWLGVAELAISTTIKYQGGSENVKPLEQYRIAFWLGTGLAVTSTVLFSTVKLGNTSSTLTANEKEINLEADLWPKESPHIKSYATGEEMLPNLQPDSLVDYSSSGFPIGIVPISGEDINTMDTEVRPSQTSCESWSSSDRSHYTHWQLLSFWLRRKLERIRSVISQTSGNPWSSSTRSDYTYWDFLGIRLRSKFERVRPLEKNEQPASGSNDASVSEAS